MRTAFLIAAVATAFTPSIVRSAETVTREQDELLRTQEKTERPFLKHATAKTISYFHQRTIGEAIVEKDFIRYRFDARARTLVDKKVRWREDLPKKLPKIISKSEAEAKVEGTVEFSNLFFISPDSDVFPIKPTPTNPCWVVTSTVDGRQVVTVVDAVTGERLGNGVPPPHEGLAIHGPDWGACPQNPIWHSWAQNAKTWFDQMGYTAERVGNASHAVIQADLQSDVTAMFYELDHGGSVSFHNTCNSNLTAGDVSTWLAGYASMPFAFIGSCQGTCSQGPNTFSYEFRKGFAEDSAIVGYCGMSEARCAQCWTVSIDWQTDLFMHMADGDTVADAVDAADAAYPTCPNGGCMQFVGDDNLTVVPVVFRSLCGSLANTTFAEVSPRGFYLRCDVAAGAAPADISPGSRLIFMNSSKLAAVGTLSARGTTGAETALVSEMDRTKGIRLAGEIKLYAGGQIKIHE
jgi:hypothetical protein